MHTSSSRRTESAIRKIIGRERISDIHKDSTGELLLYGFCDAFAISKYNRFNPLNLGVLVKAISS